MDNILDYVKERNINPDIIYISEAIFRKAMQKIPLTYDGGTLSVHDVRVVSTSWIKPNQMVVNSGGKIILVELADEGDIDRPGGQDSE